MAVLIIYLVFSYSYMFGVILAKPTYFKTKEEIWTFLLSPISMPVYLGFRSNDTE